jgi:hypothetical protein
MIKCALFSSRPKVFIKIYHILDNKVSINVNEEVVYRFFSNSQNNEADNLKHFKYKNILSSYGLKKKLYVNFKVLQLRTNQSIGVS